MRRPAHPRRRRLARGLSAIVVTTSLVIGGLAAFLSASGHRDTATYDEEAVLVLGATVRGSEVSGALAGRLEKAIEYRDRNPYALIVVSGGPNPDADVTEAAAMREYLTGRGVPASAIVVEDRATSTRENVAFSRALLDERLASGYRVCLVTDAFHVFRAGRMADAAGLDTTHLASATTWYEQPVDHLRELVAVALMWAGRL